MGWQIIETKTLVSYDLRASKRVNNIIDRTYGAPTLVLYLFTFILNL